MAENKLNIDLIINDKEALAKLKASLGDIEGAAKKGGDGITKGMLTAGAAIAAATVVGQKLVEVMGEAIQAAAEQEEAVNRLNNALRLQGTYTDKVSQEFQDMATEMSKNSRFADEAINQVQQRLTAIGGVVPQQMRAATQATLDLASVLGIDLPQAASLMAKAAQGETAMLERQIPALKGLISEHMSYAEVLRLVNREIGGSAQADMNSFAAKQANMAKAWGEVLEEMGKFITESPIIRAAMDKIAQGMNNIADGLKRIREEDPDVVSHTLERVFAVAQAFMSGGPTAVAALAGKTLAEHMLGTEKENEEKVTKLAETVVEAKRSAQDILDAENDAKEEAARQKYIEGEMAKIDQLRVVWDMWNNEKSAKAMAQMQTETDFMNLAIQTQQLAHESMWKTVGKVKDQFQSGVGDMFKQMVRGTFDAGEAFKQLGLKMVDILIDYGVQLAVNAALSKVFSATQVGVSAATGAAVAAAWAPAAAAASLATLGANSTAASAALVQTHALSRALSAVPALAEGGDIRGAGAVLVGERGPELLNLPQGARVTPLSGSSRVGAGGDINISIEINNPVMGTEDQAKSLARVIATHVSEFLDVERERL